jgi:hypothetical protein
MRVESEKPEAGGSRVPIFTVGRVQKGFLTQIRIVLFAKQSFQGKR